MPEETRVAKEILAHLHGQKDSRATAEELIAIVTAPPAQFCAGLNRLRAAGFVQAREFSEEFVQQGGDASFHMSVLLTIQGQAHYVDLVRREAGQS